MVIDPPPGKDKAYTLGIRHTVAKMIQIAVGGGYCVRNRTKPYSQFLHLQHSPVPSTPRRLRDLSEDETMGNHAVMSSPSFAPTSPTFSLEPPIWGIDDGPEGETMEILPLVPPPTYSPVPPGFRPVSPIFSRGGLEEITPIQSLDQTIQPNTIENQVVLPAPFAQEVELPTRQPLSTPTANLRSPDIRRLENIFRAANRRVSMETSARNITLQTHIQWGSQLADYFNIENIVRNVKDILSQVNPQGQMMNSDVRIRLRGVYRFPPKNTNPTSASRFMEALKLWRLGQYSAAKTSHRLFQYSRGRRSCRGGVGVWVYKL
ncbi:hypothetical protein VE02_04197 [Pseudogymnoascus sp. 03VT05]|nr:hypothetical protein VE02_04197 [Pseudogymnoascus sp. 03VT05]